MTASILAIGTALPPTRLHQGELRDLLAAQPAFGRLQQRLIRAAFDASAIDERRTVLPELAGGDATPLAMRADDLIADPSTAGRNDEFRRSAPALFEGASRDALGRAGIAPERVTHVVTVSCTGVFAPGPDWALARALGLPPTAQRYHLGFIGCAAALPALRLAAQLVAADPAAIVLVAIAELCSLHVTLDPEPDAIVAASLFADGAAAAVVAGPATAADEALASEPARPLRLEGFATHTMGEGEEEMAWTVGDNGFRMTLTAEVPRLIGREIAGIVPGLVGDADDIDRWAVHPGGRSILDRVEDAMGLAPDALAASRSVLRTHGNMSSATILFVLDEIRRDPATAPGARIATLAFGPGLTVEAATVTAGGAGA